MLSELLQIIWTSIKVSGLSVLIAAAVALPAAVALMVYRFPGRRALILINQTLMAAPTVVIGLLLYMLLSRSGPLGSLGLLYTPAAITIGQAVLVLPIITGFSYSALQQVDSRARLTAVSLGANSMQVGWLVIQEARLALVMAVLAAFARAISEIGIAMMLGGNIRHATRTMTTAIALESAKGDFTNSIILGCVLLVITLGINVAVFYFTGSHELDE